MNNKNIKTDENYIIREEQPADYRTVENLTREAFWNVYRPGCTEHFVLHNYRDNADFIKELDLVLELNGKIIGHIMFAKSFINKANGERAEIATFGPFSIAPEFQGKGYGAALLNYALDKAEKTGIPLLAITGNEKLYGKFGFIKGKDAGIIYRDDPTADYFLVKELKKGCAEKLKGSYSDPSAYFVDESDAEEFDKTFPPKKKEKLSGQL